MKHNYFGVNLEFDHDIFFERIYKFVHDSQAGYVCVVDSNVLTLANKSKSYRKIINHSLVNTCDGSSIAFFAGKLHGKPFRALNGPEIFVKLLQVGHFKHLLLGNTSATYDLIRKKMVEEGLNNENIQHLDLPFLSVESFNYPKIAEQINSYRPDLIWVSLGAPKQERFMSQILPFLHHGVMFGIGAAFNFYIGEIRMSKFSFFGLRFIWLNRFFNDPVRLGRRLLPFILLLPKMIFSEYRKIKFNNDS